MHAGIGSDFDGGFGLQSIPPELGFDCRSADDCVQIAWSGATAESDAANILGGNWLRFLREHLPA